MVEEWFITIKNNSQTTYVVMIRFKVNTENRFEQPPQSVPYSDPDALTFLNFTKL